MSKIVMKNEKILQLNEDGYYICPFDSSHTYHISRKFHHLKRCTKIRDWAYSSILPFAKAKGDFTYETINLLNNEEEIYPEIDGDGKHFLHQKVNTAFKQACEYIKVPENFFLGEKLPQLYYSENDCKSYHKTHFLLSNHTFENHMDDLSGHIINSTILQSSKNAVENRKNSKLNQHTDKIKNLVSSFKSSIPHQKDIMSGYLINNEILNTISDYNLTDLFSNLNNDEIQNALILTTCLTFGLLKTTSKISEQLILDYGGGKGSLARWFSFATRFIGFYQNNNFVTDDFSSNNKIIETDVENFSHEQSRIIIIERESRRNKKEKKDENMKDCKDNLSSKIIRLRQDIQHFDFHALLCYCNYSDETIKQTPYIPDFIQWLVKEDVRLNCDLQDLNSIKQLLFKMGSGGGPDIKKIDDSLSKFYYNHNVKRVLVIAKHLCGKATDYALKNVVEDFLKYNANSHTHNTSQGFQNKSQVPVSISIAIATCCYHRCDTSELIGRDFLINILGFTMAEITALLSKTSWATASYGRKMLLGKKIKAIIDISRIWWLRKNGFPNASLIRYTPYFISPEDLMICASNDINEMY